MDYAKLKQDLQSGGSLYFRPQDGQNRIRVVSEPVEVWKAFDKETKTARVYVTAEGAKADREARRRHMVYVINRANGALQIAEFGPSVMQQFVDLATNDEYKFDSLPPYDMILTKAGSGMETTYNLVAARQNTELLPTEHKLILEAKRLIDVIKEDALDGDKLPPV